MKFNILLLASEFLLLLLLFVVDNIEKLQTNSDTHQFYTRHKHDPYTPTADLTTYQKGAYYAGIKLFNTLQASSKGSNHNINVFQPALKDYLLSHYFYSVENLLKLKIF
jgi:hypothetical protein